MTFTVIRSRLRLIEHLQTQWHVSIDPADATLAASGRTCSPSQLKLADDPENFPQLIDLPGGWHLGLRPRSADGAKFERVADITQQFVGHGAGQVTSTSRLPNPWLTYAKRVRVPQTSLPQTVFLHLDNARYHVIVTVNGQRLAQYVGGLEPHRIDITRAVAPGQEALIAITVGDVGVSGHREFDPHNYTGNRLPTCKELENNLVHPVNYGGFDGRQLQRVWLECVPAVRVEHVFANPKVSTGRLQYRVTLANDTDTARAVHCRSVALQGKVLVDEPVTIPARSTITINKDIAWPDAILWDIDHPHLYRLRTTLTEQGRKLDVHRDTFGFREFTINGHSYFLNGKKIHLLGNSGHVGPEQDAMTLKQKMRFLSDLKRRCHLNHIRLHARPQDPRWVLAADRVGMLITTETALWTTGFHSFDWVGSEQACYENVRNHFLEALVRRDRNRPSVVIWSLSNEMSPITPFDLEQPKMAAMTRVFERIIEEAQHEDDSRVIQMSSAMDFVGRLRMYNLHYPKSWQAFPDYPHTAYWLDSSYLFPWYGPRKEEMPSWSWRKDKPLYFGEYTCVFGATPDSQASIVGDVAFDQPDGGTALVQEKLWPMEARAYRRRDVSGFCAWAFALGHETAVDELIAKPEVRAYARALRPLAVLDHSFRTRYFEGDEVAIELSIHNDTRVARAMSLVCEVFDGATKLWQQSMPAASFGPAESLAFTCRYRAPKKGTTQTLTFRATLTAEGNVVDQWNKSLHIQPRLLGESFPGKAAIYDPDGILTSRLSERGIQGVQRIDDLESPEVLKNVSTLWLNFDQGKLTQRQWQGVRANLHAFVEQGGCVVLDQPPAFTWGDLPVKLQQYKGYAPGNRLEITYAYNIAPHHPVMRGLSDTEFSLWGADYYVARNCIEIPQEGNALPLLVAGTDRAGLTASPLLELRQGRGRWLVSMLEITSKLHEEPLVARVMQQLLGSGAQQETSPQQVGAAVGSQTLRVLREVGFDGHIKTAHDALDSDVAIIDGEQLPADVAMLKQALQAGKTVYLHDLGVENTRQVLRELGLPGAVREGKIHGREHDTIRHASPLADGLSSNYLFWIINKSKVAVWTLAPLHPEPASALIELPGDVTNAANLTRRGAATEYRVGAGRLVIDNLRWQLPELDEPERPRRYVMTLLTNLGVPLHEGAAKRMSQEFETEAERRERGHF